jgi:hypothetical protein
MVDVDRDDLDPERSGTTAAQPLLGFDAGSFWRSVEKRA